MSSGYQSRTEHTSSESGLSTLLPPLHPNNVLSDKQLIASHPTPDVLEKPWEKFSHASFLVLYLGSRQLCLSRPELESKIKVCSRYVAEHRVNGTDHCSTEGIQQLASAFAYNLSWLLKKCLPIKHNSNNSNTTRTHKKNSQFSQPTW